MPNKEWLTTISTERRDAINLKNRIYRMENAELVNSRGRERYKFKKADKKAYRDAHRAECECQQCRKPAKEVDPAGTRFIKNLNQECRDIRAGKKRALGDMVSK